MRRWLERLGAAGLALCVFGCGEIVVEQSADAVDDTASADVTAEDSKAETGPDAVVAPLLDGPCQRLYGVEEAEARGGEVHLFGTLLPLATPNGQGRDRAVELAVSEMNDNGGLLGKRVGVLACDDGGTVEGAKAAAQHLVAVAEVPAIIGAASSANTIAAFTEVARPAKVLMISPSATAAAMTHLADDNLLWRTATSDTTQSAAMVQYIADQGFQRVYVANRDDTYGNGFRDRLQEQLCDVLPDCAAGFETQSYRVEAAHLEDDQAAIVADVEAFQPDALVIVGLHDDGKRLLELADGKAKRFLLSDGLKSDDLKALPATLLRVVVGFNAGSPGGAAYQGFKTRYEAKFKDDDGPVSYAAHAYDAMYLVGYAVAASTHLGGPVTGERLAYGLGRLSEGDPVKAGGSAFNEMTQKLSTNPDQTLDFEGASGPLDFDPATGEAPGPIESWCVTSAGLLSLGVVLDTDGTFTAPDTSGCVN